MNYQPSKRNSTYTQQETMWHLWSQGKSLSEMGRQLNKHAGSVFCYLQKSGGIKPSTPKRSTRNLSLKEREEISRGIAANLSLRAIARDLNYVKSIVIAACRNTVRFQRIDKPGIELKDRNLVSLLTRYIYEISFQISLRASGRLNKFRVG